MKILIPPSEGKAKVRSLEVLFKDTNFQFAKYTQQIVTIHLSRHRIFNQSSIIN